jgi:hypothetical protein
VDAFHLWGIRSESGAATLADHSLHETERHYVEARIQDLGCAHGFARLADKKINPIA